MSIWTSLLFLHGHIATPRALAFLESPAAPAPSAATPPDAPDAPQPRNAGSASTVVRPMVVHHPLRVIGQLS
jgi:hypothetical protein